MNESRITVRLLKMIKMGPHWGLRESLFSLSLSYIISKCILSVSDIHTQAQRHIYTLPIHRQDRTFLNCQTENPPVFPRWPLNQKHLYEKADAL